MYTIIVEDFFSATHRLRLADGSTEPRHGHDWRVRAHFSTPGLDSTGMVIDFTLAKKALKAVLNSLNFADLNCLASLAGKNPTAEIIAKFVYDGLVDHLAATVRRVEVTEAPGCVAVYERSPVDQEENPRV